MFEVVRSGKNDTIIRVFGTFDAAVNCANEARAQDAADMKEVSKGYTGIQEFTFWVRYNDK